MTGTAGADWKGGGEIKALRRIVGGSAEEDEGALALIGHNHTTAVAVYEATGSAIAMEEQARVVERVLAEAEGVMGRVGRELIRLRAIFFAVELERREQILRLRAEGLSQRDISAKLGIGHHTVGRYIRAAAEGRELKLDNHTKGRFLNWAMTRFRFTRHTLTRYISYGADPGKPRAKVAWSNARQKSDRRLVSLIRASKNGKVAPPVFKQAFLALGDRGAASRRAVACWIVSLEAGSDDPQEVARWFAAHRLV